MHKMILKQHTHYSALTNRLCSRWTHFQRTVPDEWIIWTTGNTIRDQLIPALIRWEVSDAERQILALPLRHGGLGLTDPRETAKTEYKDSTQINNKLTTKIYTQKLAFDYNPSDQLYTTHEKHSTTRKEAKCQNSRDELLKDIMAVSLANQSDQISTKQTRIHGCRLHETWMEGERHTHSLCLWKDKLYGSQPHM